MFMNQHEHSLIKRAFCKTIEYHFFKVWSNEQIAWSLNVQKTSMDSNS